MNDRKLLLLLSTKMYIFYLYVFPDIFSSLKIKMVLLHTVFYAWYAWFEWMMHIIDFLSKRESYCSMTVNTQRYPSLYLVLILYYTPSFWCICNTSIEIKHELYVQWKWYVQKILVNIKYHIFTALHNIPFTLVTIYCFIGVKKIHQ